MSKETLRVGSLNTKLQEQSVKSNLTIKELSEKAINTATGGKTFCYLYISYLTGKGGIPVFITKGSEPLYGVSAKITDMKKFKAWFTTIHPLPIPKSITDNQQLAAEYFQSAEYIQSMLKDNESLSININISDISLTVPPMRSDIWIPFDQSDEQVFNVFFDSTRKKSWGQRLILKNNNNSRFVFPWLQATKVMIQQMDE